MNDTYVKPDAYEEAKRLAADLEQTVDHIERLGNLDERGSAAAESLEEELNERVLSADVNCTINVTLYTGGPAGGIEFSVYREDGEWQLDNARAWHQEWFETKRYAELDNDVASYLFEHWGIAYVGYR